VRNLDPALDQILPVGKENGHQRGVQAIHPTRWNVHLIEVK